MQSGVSFHLLTVEEAEFDFWVACICDINMRSVFPIQILQANPLRQC